MTPNRTALEVTRHHFERPGNARDFSINTRLSRAMIPLASWNDRYPQRRRGKDDEAGNLGPCVEIRFAGRDVRGGDERHGARHQTSQRQPCRA